MRGAEQRTELNRIAESTHHEGLCVAARPRRWLSTADLADALARTKGTAVALDRVRNPYNIGAILRSAAFFGVDAVLLGTPAPHPGLAPAAVQVAEGGASTCDGPHDRPRRHACPPPRTGRPRRGGRR